MHNAIQEFHWTPSEIDEFLNSDNEVKAFYYASCSVVAEQYEKLKKKD